MNVSIRLWLVLLMGCAAISAGAQSVSVGKINRNSDTPAEVEPTSSAAPSTEGKKAPAKIARKRIAKKAAPEGLRSVLLAWGNKEHWTLKWADGIDDVPLPTGTRLDGYFESMVGTITKAIPPNATIQITMYEGDKVIYVTTRVTSLAQPFSAVPLRPSLSPSFDLQPLIVITSGSYSATKLQVAPQKSTVDSPLKKPAPPVAQTPVPAAPQIWKAAAGSTLRKSVERWIGESNEWHIKWIPQDLDYPIDGELVFQGTFEYAVTTIFNLFKDAERPMLVDGNSTQKLIIVSEKPKK